MEVLRRRVGRRDSHWFGFKNENVLCLFSSFQTPADTSNIHRKAGARIYGIKNTHTPMHTADDSYKYNRTRVRSDCYTVLKALPFKRQLYVKKWYEGESGVTNAMHTLFTQRAKTKQKGFRRLNPAYQDLPERDNTMLLLLLLSSH